MSLAQGNNTPTRPRIEPGSPDPESDALTTRPVSSPKIFEGFLAHLSQRLIGELIGYSWSGVRPSSTISNVFFSETAGPIKAKFYVEPP